MNKNINNVFYGSVAKTLRETQAVSEGLILELSGRWLTRRKEKCFRRGVHVRRKSGEDSAMSLAELVVGPRLADLNFMCCVKFYGI